MTSATTKITILRSRLHRLITNVNKAVAVVPVNPRVPTVFARSMAASIASFSQRARKVCVSR